MAQQERVHEDSEWPEQRLVAQWVRHVNKVRRQLETQEWPGALRLCLEAENVSRYVTVTDGDGMMAAGLRMRLHGIDAPEYHQTCRDNHGKEWPCGKRAARRLRELLRCGRVEFIVHGVDMHGRLLVTCLAAGQDVGEVLVREGLAVAYRDERYAEVEQAARRRRVGIWRGTFERPETWRRKRQSSSPSSGLGSCASGQAVVMRAAAGNAAGTRRHEHAFRAARLHVVPKEKEGEDVEISAADRPAAGDVESSGRAAAGASDWKILEMSLRGLRERLAGQAE